jgi:hypothetical protein
MEIFGLIEAKSGYPPLTDCIREYVPEWLAFALLFFFVGLGGGTWFQVCPRYGLAVLVGFLGWLTAHFSVTFNQPKAFQETVKYAWWAKKFGGPGQRVSRWLLGRRATTAEEVWPLEAANRRGATGTTEPGPKEPDVP